MLTIDTDAHRLASEMTTHRDPAAVAAYAAALQALLAYRATYHGPSTPSALPPWCRVGQATEHAGKRGEIVVREDALDRIVIRYPDGDHAIGLASLTYVLPVGEDGRVDRKAMGFEDS
jgi:hypothetical protein